MENKIQLTKRDLTLLLGLHDYTVLSHSQIALWFFPDLSRPTVSNRILKLERSGYVRSLQVGIQIHHGREKKIRKIYTTTKRALKILQAKYPERKIRDEPLPFNTLTLYHDLCLNEVIRRFEKRQTGTAISHGRLLKFTEGDRLRVPDAVIDSPNDAQKIAIELELTAKSETRYREIVMSYRLSKLYSKVLYIVGNNAIRDKIIYAVTGYRPRPELPLPDLSPFEVVPMRECI